jgi:small subunit ribosomal protein S6
MRDYETVFILDPKLDNDQVNDEIAKIRDLISSHEGEVIGVEPGGKRKLAYEINGNKEGYYTLISFKSKPSSLPELERLYKLNENVLRHIIVNATVKRAEGREAEQADS